MVDFGRKLQWAHALSAPSDAPRFGLLPSQAVWPNPGMAPGRPIISDCGSNSQNASNLIEFFLQPVRKRLPSHLKDSSHLIALLRTATVSPASILFTFDVAALYTNVPIEEGIECVAQAFLRHPDTKRPDATILSLLRLLLTSNTFSFGGATWLQVHGVAMGKTFGGSFANIFLGAWEHGALSSFPLKPTLWVRFQDDIFGIWNHGEASLVQFQQHLNAQHPRISLTLRSGKTVDFLDLSVTAVGDSLHYSIYAKDTDTHFLLTKDSHHPSHTFRGIIFGEYLRFASHSSTREAFNNTVSGVLPVWRSLGYSRSLLRSTKTAVLSRTCQLTLWPTGMFPCSPPASCRICIHAVQTSTFRHPFNNVVYPIISRITCRTTCCVYLIRCKSCGAIYVGQTQRSLRTRIEQHLQNIQDQHRITPLYRHFRDVCGPASFSFFGIDVHPDTNRRLQKESRWIEVLGARVPLGLNVIASKPTRTNLILPYGCCATRVTSAIRNWTGCVTRVRQSFTRGRNLGELLSVGRQ